jgi:hypothetical protein
MTPSGKRHTSKMNDIIDEVIELRLKGHSRQQLIGYVVQEYNINPLSAQQYVRQAAVEFEQRAIMNFGQDLKEDIERWEYAAQNAYEKGDMKGYRECLRDICKLKGHYSERIDVTSKSTNLSEINIIHIKGKNQSNDISDDDILNDL